LQVEELVDTENWSRIAIGGRAEQLKDRAEFEDISRFIKVQNPTFSPAIDREMNDLSELENAIEIYRIQSNKMTGSKAKAASSHALVG
jgi:hypothetical protein